MRLSWASLGRFARTHSCRHAGHTLLVGLSSPPIAKCQPRAGASSLCGLDLPLAGSPIFPSPATRNQAQAPMNAENTDRKSTRRTPVTNAQLVCRLLLEKKKMQTLHHEHTTMKHNNKTPN